jgi:hypothetical protein
MIEFTHDSYLKLLKTIKSYGREFVSFTNVPQDAESYVILRHDVDFSLKKALEMAQLDYESGISSTFFFLLTAPYYNPLSVEGASYIKEIAALGHNCGLHFDCTGFEQLTISQRQRRIQVMAKTLEDATGVEIKAVAQHKPASTPIRLELPNFVRAYSHPFFKDIAYISDSRKMFRHHDILHFFKENKKVQMLIHPIWWNKTDMNRSEILQRLFSNISSEIRQHINYEERSIEKYLALNNSNA